MSLHTVEVLVLSPPQEWKVNDQVIYQGQPCLVTATETECYFGRIVPVSATLRYGELVDGFLVDRRTCQECGGHDLQDITCLSDRHHWSFCYHCHNFFRGEEVTEEKRREGYAELAAAHIKAEVLLSSGFADD